MRSRLLPIFLVIALSILLVSCSDNEGDGNITSPEIEAEYDIEVDYPGEPYFTSQIKTVESYPLFSQVIHQKGYRVHPGDAARFKTVDKLTGDAIDVTMIPCTIADDRSRIAVIYYFRNDDNIQVTSAEYFEDEDFDIPHSLDEEVYGLMLSQSPDLISRFPVSMDPEIPKTFWKCVGKRFAAGCLGCALKCYLTGPAWGVCTLNCCAGAAIIAMVSCAFTIYGW